jgi:pimeloyl-ACP methyl ester carboxylesterase
MPYINVGEEAVRDSWNVAAGASPIGTWECPQTWHTDFREDLGKIEVPTLVTHGTDDRILPIEATEATEAGINRARLAFVGAPATWRPASARHSTRSQ